MKTVKTSTANGNRFHYTPTKSTRFDMFGGGQTIVVIPMDPAKRWPGMQSRLVIDRDQLYLGDPDPKDELYVVGVPVTLTQAISWLRACHAIEPTRGEAEMELLKWAAARLSGQ